MPNNGTPNAADTYAVKINASGAAYTVTLDQAATVNSLTLDSSNVTFAQTSPLILTPGGALVLKQTSAYQLRTSTITGGSISIDPTASFTVPVGGNFIDTSISGSLTTGNSASLELKGTTALNDGTIHLVQTSTLNATGNGTTGFVNGTGRVIFDGKVGSYATVQSSTSFEIGSGITISTGTGSGRINVINPAQAPNRTIVNRGTISAETTGRTLDVTNSYDTSPIVTNFGTFQASNGGTLSVWNLTGDAGHIAVLGTGFVDLSGNFTLSESLTLTTGNHLGLIGKFKVTGALTAGPGSILDLGESWSNTAPISLTAGTLNVTGAYDHLPTGGGAFTVTNSDVKIGAATVTANLLPLFGNQNRLSVETGAFITNTGSIIALDATTGSLAMRGGIIADGTLTGTGGAAVNAFPSTPGLGLYSVDSSASINLAKGTNMTFGSGVGFTATGINRGLITGTGATLNLTGQWSNPGTINLTGGTLTLSGPTVTAGTITTSDTIVNLQSSITSVQLSAIGGTMKKIVFQNGRLDLGNGTFGPTAATGPIFLNSAYVQNGTLIAPDTNKIVTTGGSQATFDNITLATDLTLVPDYQLSSRNGLTLSGTTVTINNNDTELYRASGLYFTDAIQELRGTGQIVFGGTGSAAALFAGGAQTLTIGPGIIIQTSSSGGGGFIAGDSTGQGSGHIENQGIVRADGIGKRITITGLSGFHNAGRLEAINGGSIIVDGKSIFIADWTNDGTIHLENGGGFTVKGQTFTNGTTGRIEGNGTLDVSGTTFTNNGVVSPGLSPGQLTITGGFTSTSTSELDIEIAGTTPGTFDQLVINGSASVDGVLHVNFINGFVPSPTDKFTFLSAGSITGSFKEVDTNFGRFTLSASSGSLTLTSFAVPEPGVVLPAAIGTICLLSRRTKRRPTVGERRVA